MIFDYQTNLHPCSRMRTCLNQGCHSRIQRGLYANESDLNFSRLHCSEDNRGKFYGVDKTALTEFFWGRVRKFTNPLQLSKLKNEKKFFLPLAEREKKPLGWEEKWTAMLKGLQASTLRGMFERFTVTRAQITAVHCTSSWHRPYINLRTPAFTSRFFHLSFLPF